MAKKVINGPAVIVAMFRHLDPKFRAELLLKLQTISPILARLVDEFAFIYNDLLRLDNKSLQLVLRDVPEKDWLIAWKLTSEMLRKRLLENMSKSRQEQFLQAVKDQPKVPRAQVLRIQLQIAGRVHALAQAGKVKLRSRLFV